MIVAPEPDNDRPRGRGHIVLYALALTVAALLLIAVVVFKGIILPPIIRNAIATQPPPTQTVSTIKAAYDDWQPELRAVGSLRAVNGADIAAEVAGIVASIEFKSGDEVPAGTILVRLRDEDDLARLKSLETQADLARIVAERDRRQLAAKAISQATLDNDEASLRSARALADEQRAIAAKKLIRAPFAGRVGIRQVDLGQYLAAGTAVVTLQQLDPIFVDFSVPQQAYDRMKPGAAVTLAVDAFPGKTFAGEIAAADPKIDTATRNVLVRATLHNPEGKLIPGMYGTVTIAAGTPERYLTLPQAAISFSSYGNTVYVVDEKAPDAAGHRLLAARQTFVTTGATRGDQVAVLTGIKEGELVVTAGQIKLHNGSPVAINDTVQPTNDPNPKPVEK
ncbi:MAG TPA: efflux RND transporter periplasmic adaptor subunit [Stellaceae bacterium]|nr:efflux RND transporter periplasmic adaptor subunit [Stellaceae bacterium]